MKAQEYTTHSLRLTVGEDGIVRAVEKAVKISLENARENTALLASIADERRVPLLVDITESRGISREAREEYSGEALIANVCALALLVCSPVSKVMGSFFLGLNKPAIPTQLFSSEEKALSWLKKFREQGLRQD